MNKIKIKVWSKYEEKLLKKSPDDSGWDLRAAAPYSLNPGEFKTIETGIHVDMTAVELSPPFQIEAQVRARSGLGARHGIGIVNSPGTIDKNYLGPINVILINHSPTPFEIKKGDRIAQLVFVPVVKVEKIDYISRDSFMEIKSDRNHQGFGSSGLS